MQSLGLKLKITPQCRPKHSINGGKMKITFFMKSGNSFSVSGVKEWKIQYKGNEVTSISIKYGWWKVGPRLIVGALDLSQIEAMVKS